MSIDDERLKQFEDWAKADCSFSGEHIREMTEEIRDLQQQLSQANKRAAEKVRRLAESLKRNNDCGCADVVWDLAAEIERGE